MNSQIFVYYFESFKFVQLHTILNQSVSVKGLIKHLNVHCVKHSNTQVTLWNLFLHFVVFSYNLMVHLSTGFSPFVLTFGAEAHLPADLIFGFSSRNPEEVTFTSRGPLPLLLRSFATLSRAVATVRENTRLFYQREKERYDLGLVERVSQPRDLVRVRLKSR